MNRFEFIKYFRWRLLLTFTVVICSSFFEFALVALVSFTLEFDRVFAGGQHKVFFSDILVGIEPSSVALIVSLILVAGLILLMNGFLVFLGLDIARRLGVGIAANAVKTGSIFETLHDFQNSISHQCGIVATSFLIPVFQAGAKALTLILMLVILYDVYGQSVLIGAVGIFCCYVILFSFVRKVIFKIGRNLLELKAEKLRVSRDIFEGKVTLRLLGRYFGVSSTTIFCIRLFGHLDESVSRPPRNKVCDRFRDCSLSCAERL